MASINDSVQVYGVMELVEIWRELDTFMLDYWKEQEDKAKKAQEDLKKRELEKLGQTK